MTKTESQKEEKWPESPSTPAATLPHGVEEVPEEDLLVVACPYTFPISPFRFPLHCPKVKQKTGNRRQSRDSRASAAVFASGLDFRETSVWAKLLGASLSSEHGLVRMWLGSIDKERRRRAKEEKSWVMRLRAEKEMLGRTRAVRSLYCMFGCISLPNAASTALGEKPLGFDLVLGTKNRRRGLLPRWVWQVNSD